MTPGGDSPVLQMRRALAFWGARRVFIETLCVQALTQNQKIVDAISALAKKKGITNAQLCIAWVGSLGKFYDASQLFPTSLETHLVRFLLSLLR